jgi:hypothetical protein
MRICNACETEYENDISVCSDCGNPLSHILSKEEEKAFLSFKLVFVEMEGVIIANTTFEAGCMEACLKSAGIPCMRKPLGTSSYMGLLFGNSIFGEELLVPKENKAQAEELLGRFRETESCD